MRREAASGRAGAAWVVAGVVLALAFVPGGRNNSRPAAPATPSANPRTVTVLGDGSTSDTGPQPGRPPVQKLKPGQRPPQFVVLAFDGATEGTDRLLSRARAAAAANGAQVTFFLRGLDLLPPSRAALYQPPRHPAGTAAAPLPADAAIRATLPQLGLAWLNGDEIASGFNGRFCGPDGERDWSTAEWESELDQGTSFIRFWKTDTGYTDLPPLPFDDQTEVVGGRAHCVEDRTNLLAAEREVGWHYDVGDRGAEGGGWPENVGGVWRFQQQDGTTDALRRAFDRSYQGNRAPLLLGGPLDADHLATGSALLADLCHRDDVRCVSYGWLAEWLDAQDPAQLQLLRAVR